MYKLVRSTNNDIERLIEYKKETILDYAGNIDKEEYNKIYNYIINNVKENIDNYYNIIINDNIAGCLLLSKKDDGMLLDEIFLEEQYRNKGIGTDILKNTVNEYNIVYLWVYKENKRAISLYKRLGFNIIDETETRYYMKYIRG